MSHDIIQLALIIRRFCVMALSHFDFVMLWLWNSLTLEFFNFGTLTLESFDFGTLWFWNTLNLELFYFGMLWLWNALTLKHFDFGTLWLCNALTFERFDLGTLWLWNGLLKNLGISISKYKNRAYNAIQTQICSGGRKLISFGSSRFRAKGYNLGFNEAFHSYILQVRV
jgi:hypothetical protein